MLDWAIYRRAFVTDLSNNPDDPEELALAMQIYREQAHYLERTAPWVERVGLNYVKAQVVDNAENRRALRQRFLHSQTFAQIDPWKARAEGEAAHEFMPLKIA